MVRGELNWLAWWQLLRAANVFTAISNIIAGYLLVNGQWQPIVPLLMLAIVSSCCYLAGMVLNDVFDVKQDAIERPQRPIPSGRISISSASCVGIVLILSALSISVVVSRMVGTFSSVVVTLLLVFAIVNYDSWSKRTWLGPVNMGVCRFLNVLLGASVASSFTAETGVWLIASGLGIYTWGITLIARREAANSLRIELVSGGVLVATGLALIAFLPLVLPRLAIPTLAWFAAIAVLFLLGRQVMVPLFSRPTPENVQAAVKRFILMFIGIDAAVSGAAAGWASVAVVLCLLIPMKLIARWAPIT